MIDQNWIRPDGTPITGKVPPIVRVRAGALTPVARGWVAAFYSRFCANKRLCITGDSYFTASASFPDGTKVRAFSVKDVDYVYIWAGDKKPPVGVGITFWCIPWDDEWIDEAFAEVFTLPRWFDINDSNANDQDDSDVFLEDLIRNEKYEPPSAGLYPGNQTWFARPPHPSAGTVVSWWGQMRRYRMDGISQAVDNAAQWRSKDTGGIAGALAGQMFLMNSVPPFTDPKPVRAQLDNRSTVWLNGSPKPAGAPVESACLGYRDGARVVRFTSPLVSGATVAVRELRGENFTEQVLIANVDLRPAALGLGRPYLVDGTPNPANWTPLTWQMHPFYWNADGTEAIGVIGYQGFYSDFSTEWFRRSNVVIKLTVSSGGVTAEIVDTTNYVSESTTGGGQGDFSLEYSRPVAADFLQNDPVIVRTHIQQTRDGFSSGTTGTNSGSATESVNTWASINHDKINETDETKSSLVTESWSSGLGSLSHSSSGSASWWDVLAGDLRGKFLLHAGPLRTTYFGWDETVEGYLTTDLTYTSTSAGDNVIDLVRAHAPNQGKLYSCDAAGDAELLTKLSTPIDAAVMGSYHRTLSGGVVVAESSTNPYGSGLGPGYGEPFLWGVRDPGTRGGSPSTTIVTSKVDFVDQPAPWSDVVLTGSAITPDGKTQYLGAVLIAMTEPSAPLAPAQAYVVDKWFHEGNEFTPLYPPQPDPENPGDTMPFPHRGGHAILLDPIFTGPLP